MTVLDMPKVEPPRDRWDRPVIDGITYTRASTLAKALDDTGALMKWKARMTALGLAKSPDLIAGVATADPDDRGRLNRLVDQALERVASTAGATIGTAIHSATETADRGGSIAHLPLGVQNAARGYQAKMAQYGLAPLAAEVFVVCHDVTSAGTFDRLLQGPGRVMIGDIKTSANPDTVNYAALAWSVQLAVYAHGRPWLPGVGVVDWSHIGLPVPDQERGLVMHIVQDTGEVKLYTIDLRAGWIAAQLAEEVVSVRKAGKGFARLIP